MKSFIPSNILCYLRVTKKTSLLCAAYVMFGIVLSGCALMRESKDPGMTYYEEQMPVRVHQQELESMKIKIQSLEQQLAEKNALIKQINAREPDQPEVIQASSKEIARTQVKLHRLATKPSSASLISEAEVAMNFVKQQLTIQSDEDLLAQAKRLLDAAVTSYTQAD